MNTRPFLLVDVGNLVQSTVAHQPPMRQRQIRFFADNGGLDFHHLGDVIAARFEFVGFDAIVDAGQHVAFDVVTVVDAAQVFDEVLEPHAAFGFQVGRVQIGVEHDDGERHDEDLERAVGYWNGLIR